MNAVDTNVLAYALDAHDPERQRMAERLLSTLTIDDTVVPWQVACEIGSVLQTMHARGRFRGDCDTAVAACRERFRIVLPTLEVLTQAQALQRAHQLSYWDSLLIAACAEAGVRVLYSEDLQSRAELVGVRIVNPFL